MAKLDSNSKLISALDASIETRHVASQALEQALRELLSGTAPISEIALCDLWLQNIRKHSSIYSDGWYTPPPHGMFVQFATEDDPRRVNQPSNRRPDAWPRSDIFLNRRSGLISAYASPVDRTTGLIGDFAISLYLGSDQDIQAFHKKALDLDIDLYEALAPGMQYSQIADKCSRDLSEHDMYNTVDSPSDPAGTNIGHTIPASDTGWSSNDVAVFEAGSWGKISKLISSKRVFINNSEQRRIPLTSAHTIEPRPMSQNDPNLPMINYHTMVVWKDGRKQLVTFFGELFRFAGMNYMFDKKTIPFL